MFCYRVHHGTLRGSIGDVVLANVHFKLGWRVDRERLRDTVNTDLQPVTPLVVALTDNSNSWPPTSHSNGPAQGHGSGPIQDVSVSVKLFEVRDSGWCPMPRWLDHILPFLGADPRHTWSPLPSPERWLCLSHLAPLSDGFPLGHCSLPERRRVFTTLCPTRCHPSRSAHHRAPPPALSHVQGIRHRVRVYRRSC